MRRVVSAAAVCGTLVLAACSDQTTTEPTPPPQPEQSITSCRPSPHFPIVQVSALIVKVFPKGKLQVEALARGAAIAALWETCKTTLAQKAAADFVNFMNANSSKLTGTQTQRNTLVNLILNGVGITATVPTESPGDFGIGFFDPTKTTNTVIKTQSNTALIRLEPGSFSEPTTIVISRRLDGSNPLNFEGDQFPPFFDYDATNASGNHILENNKTAIVGFCLLDPAVTYPENPRIGHNPVQLNRGAPSGLPTFEILDPVDLAAEGLALQCGNLQPNTFVIGGFGQGLPGLANAAWRTAKYYVGPVAEAMFLPQALYAATLGTLPPPGGRAASLSPFGIVDATPDFTIQNSGETDPAGGTFTVGEPIDTCGDACFPSFRISNGEGSESGTITATLVPVDGSTGTLSGTTSVSTGDGGVAEFNNLIVSAAGTYKLKFSAVNSAPYVTEIFRVATAGVTQLACNQEGTVKSLESNKAVNLQFTNNTAQAVSVYWLNFDGLRQYPFPTQTDGIGAPYKVLAPAEVYTQGTFVTHPWILIGADNTCYGIFLPGTSDASVAVPVVVVP
jgi:hypothetical protein